jgi:hypothetical protein
MPSWRKCCRGRCQPEQVCNGPSFLASHRRRAILPQLAHPGRSNDAVHAARKAPPTPRALASLRCDATEPSARPLGGMRYHGCPIPEARGYPISEADLAPSESLSPGRRREQKVGQKPVQMTHCDAEVRDHQVARVHVRRVLLGRQDRCGGRGHDHRRQVARVAHRRGHPGREGRIRPGSGLSLAGDRSEGT